VKLHNAVCEDTSKTVREDVDAVEDSKPDCVSIQMQHGELKHTFCGARIWCTSKKLSRHIRERSQPQRGLEAVCTQRCPTPCQYTAKAKKEDTDRPLLRKASSQDDDSPSKAEKREPVCSTDFP
jgi:hypothetical protein